MSDNKDHLYRIPAHLDKGKSIAGQPLDEIIPALVLFGLLIMKSVVLAFGLAALWIFAMKKLKKGNGSSYLSLLLFWYLPSQMTKTLFKKTPAADKKYWLN